MCEGCVSGRQKAYYSIHDLQRTFRKFIRECLAAAAQREGKRFVSEKTPDNVFCFRELAELFPDAKFVFVVRDPRAVLHSMHKVQARARAQGRTVGVGSSLWDDMRYVAKAIEHGDRFHRSEPTKCFVVYYEEFVRSPEAVARALCEFIEVNYSSLMLRTSDDNPAVMSVVQSDGVWYTAEMYNRPIDEAGADAWRKEMSRTRSLRVADYFAQQSSPVLSRYGLKRAASLVRWSFLPDRLWEKGRNWYRRQVQMIMASQVSNSASTLASLQ